MADDAQYAELIDYLRNDGRSDEEIEKILVCVGRYEAETQHDSIMDLIGNGTLDLAAIVREALGGS